MIYSTILYSTLLYSTLLYSTLLYSTLFYSILLYSTLFYSILFYYENTESRVFPNLYQDPPRMENEDRIAIVGVGCRFPGADNIDEFWRVLSKGENHVIEIPPDRWNLAACYNEDADAVGKTYVRKAGFVKK